jgi:hypothetical protein
MDTIGVNFALSIMITCRLLVHEISSTALDVLCACVAGPRQTPVFSVGPGADDIHEVEEGVGRGDDVCSVGSCAVQGNDAEIRTHSLPAQRPPSACGGRTLHPQQPVRRVGFL